jgi:hypothetical protein
MLQVEFKPTIPVFERAKTIHALDRAATVIDLHIIIFIIIIIWCMRLLALRPPLTYCASLG